MLARDLREAERRSFPHTQLMLQISGHFPPRQMRNRPNVRDPHYEEALMPARLGDFSAQLGTLSAFLKPNQDMANGISLELARGAGMVPAYTPFIMPLVSGPPHGRYRPASTRLQCHGGGTTPGKRSARMHRRLCRCRLGCYISFASC